MNSHFGELIVDKTESSDEKKKKRSAYSLLTVAKLVVYVEVSRVNNEEWE